jgi:hypothetical protein
MNKIKNIEKWKRWNDRAISLKSVV